MSDSQFDTTHHCTTMQTSRMSDTPKNEPKAPNTNRNTVKLCSAGDNAEASIIRGYLEDAGIGVYIQGENHRSMLGMVGAYIELNILVSEHDYEEAAALMVAFEDAGQEDDSAGVLEGPFRDNFEEEDTTDWELKNDIARRTRGVRMVALFFPFGGAHFAAGAPVRGLFLAALGITGIAIAASGGQGFMALLCPLSMFMDFKTVGTVVKYKMRREKDQRLLRERSETSESAS